MIAINMVKEIRALSFSKSFRNGIRERGKTEPTKTYLELATRNLFFTGANAIMTIGFLGGAIGLVAHDVLSSGIIERISQGQEPAFLTQPQSFIPTYLEQTFANDKLAVAATAMAGVTALSTVGYAGFTVGRKLQFASSLIKDLSHKSSA